VRFVHSALLEAAKRAAGWQHGITAQPGLMRVEQGVLAWMVRGRAGWLRMEVAAEGDVDLEAGATGAAVLDVVRLVSGREEVFLSSDAEASQVVLVAAGGYRDVVPMAEGWQPARQAEVLELAPGPRVWSWQMPNQELVQLLELGCWAAAADEASALAVVELEARGAAVTVRASDGVKVAQVTGGLLEAAGEGERLVLPIAAAKRWLELAKGQPELSKAVIANRTEMVVVHWGNTEVVAFTQLEAQVDPGLAAVLGGIKDREPIARVPVSTALRRDLAAVCGHGGSAVVVRSAEVLTVSSLHRPDISRQMAVELPATVLGEGEIAIDSAGLVESFRLLGGQLELSVGEVGMNRTLLIEAAGSGGVHTLIALVGLAV